MAHWWPCYAARICEPSIDYTEGAHGTCRRGRRKAKMQGAPVSARGAECSVAHSAGLGSGGKACLWACVA
eukprot:1214420-Prorocentrum_lima.AAC.1